MLPPSYWNEHTPQAVKWLWQTYKWAIGEMGHVDLLVLTGDLVEGKARKSDGTGVYTADMSGQTAIAMECLAEIAPHADRIIRVVGTPYHEGFDGTLRALDERYGIKRPSNRMDEIARNIVLDPVRELVLNVKHAPEGGDALYQGTIRDRETLWARISESYHGTPHASILVRGHVHCCTSFHSGDISIHTVPCFKLQDAYAMGRKQYRWMPEIGCLRIDLDDTCPEGYNVRRILARLGVHAGPQPQAWEEL